MPTTRTSQQEIERALHVLTSRDSLDRLYRRLTARAGIELDPLFTWLLFRFVELSSSGKGSVFSFLPEVLLLSVAFAFGVSDYKGYSAAKEHRFGQREYTSYLARKVEACDGG